jgi:hypothetical protein
MQEYHEFRQQANGKGMALADGTVRRADARE